MVVNADVGLSLAVMARVRAFPDAEINAIERHILGRMKLRPEFIKLNTILGVGDILGLTVMLEAGHMGRFRGVGNYCIGIISLQPRATARSV
jgi:transposase